MQQLTRYGGDGVGVMTTAHRHLQRYPYATDSDAPEARLSTGTGVFTIADLTPWSAATTQPCLAAKCDGGAASASSGPCRPEVAVRAGQAVQADPLFDTTGEGSAADRATPRHASVTGVRVIVRKGAERTSCFGQGLIICKLRVGHRYGAHQRTVAGRVPSALMRGRALLRADFAETSAFRP